MTESHNIAPSALDSQSTRGARIRIKVRFLRSKAVIPSADAYTVHDVHGSWHTAPTTAELAQAHLGSTGMSAAENEELDGQHEPVVSASEPATPKSIKISIRIRFSRSRSISRTEIVQQGAPHWHMVHAAPYGSAPITAAEAIEAYPTGPDTVKL